MKRSGEEPSPNSKRPKASVFHTVLEEGGLIWGEEGGSGRDGYQCKSASELSRHVQSALRFDSHRNSEFVQGMGEFCDDDSVLRRVLQPLRPKVEATGLQNLKMNLAQILLGVESIQTDVAGYLLEKVRA